MLNTFKLTSSASFETLILLDKSSRVLQLSLHPSKLNG